MRSRKVREGSVGLLILFGVGMLGFLIFWLRDIALGKKGYTIVAEFDNIAKLQIGGVVRYRGVQVGRVKAISPSTNGVEVELGITATDLVMPSEVIIEANQAGFIGEASIDIIPLKPVTSVANAPDPLDQDCNSDVILCDRDRLKGRIGVTFDELLRSTLQFSKSFGDPRFVAGLGQLMQNSTSAMAEIAQLSRQLNMLSVSIDKQLTPLSASATRSVTALEQAANRVNGTIGEFSATSTQIRNTVAQFSTITNQLQGTAKDVNALVVNLNQLVASNRSTLVGTLDNLNATSLELRGAVNNLKPALASVQTGLQQVERSEILGNLETISSNLAQVSLDATRASTNLRDFSNSTNLLQLQQTLDSARTTFQNVEKITSDLDRLTGDPNFLNNLRELIDTLNQLLSTTENLEEQTALAHNLAILTAAISPEIEAISPTPGDNPAASPLPSPNQKMPEGQTR
ncbi:MAG TPA: MCE family protein [Oscillatoriaceae cyanobacterium M33_DOE_052]|uniref:MCE family protein n=1 Tax=Planktothricoides sp. SpSt-374 TaxID=2282167 RepID=A0A7C3VEA6_9CYAN|nr:MCE family protein [Oscillatoriaceae cyanobacterium M33_DOE_052]